jgi:hypothetical protein
MARGRQENQPEFRGVAGFTWRGFAIRGCEVGLSFSDIRPGRFYRPGESVRGAAFRAGESVSLLGPQDSTALLSVL